MEFKKYQHVERYGTTEVEGIEIGECYIFPKIDGTNASVWLDDGKLQAGSRRRHLTLDNDNAGFYQWVSQQQSIIDYLKANPTHRLFGEWLVPHSLRTYRDEAWNRFYVFDVAEDIDGVMTYLHYNEYQPLLEEYAIDYITPISIVINPSYEQLINQLAKNVFLIQDGKGSGEGIVIKNYEYRNKYGRQTWAKIVTSEFKEKNAKVMGTAKLKGKKMIEEEIVNQYVTKALCEKVKAKIELDNNGFSSKDIPRLLNTVYHDLITEESWNFVKKYKNPVINYKTLQQLVILQVKRNLPTVF